MVDNGLSSKITKLRSLPSPVLPSPKTDEGFFKQEVLFTVTLSRLFHFTQRTFQTLRRVSNNKSLHGEYTLLRI